MRPRKTKYIDPQFASWPKRTSWHWESQTDWGPGSEGHRKQRWNAWVFFTPIFAVISSKRWDLHFPFDFKLQVNADNHHSTWGSDIRRGKFQKVVVEVQIPGAHLKVHYTWPTWTETLEVFEEHHALNVAKQRAVTAYMKEIGCPTNHGYWEFTTSRSDLLPPQPMFIDGQVSLVRPVFGMHCSQCRARHGIWPGELADLLNTRSIRDKDDDQRRADEQAAEALALLTTGATHD